MSLLLLIIIYLIFISLGLPDSLISSSWPAISQSLSLDPKWQGLISFLIALFTIISSFSTAKFIKIFTTKGVILISIILTIIIVNILQFIIGGVIFGFDSYNLNAIIYDSQTQQISTLNLFNYIMQIWISKIPLYILLTLISILIGVNISNIATNILITLGIYAISKIDILNKYIISYYADFTNFLSNNITQKDFMHAILIVCSSMTIILILIIHKFKNKEINNEK